MVRAKLKNTSGPKPRRISAKRPRPLSARSSSRGKTDSGKPQTNKLKRGSGLLAGSGLPSSATLRDIGELTFGRRETSIAAVKAERILAEESQPSTRTQVQDTTAIPWRKICDLGITARDGSLHSGTAWFISERMLLTAGHCISVFSPGAPAVHGLVRNILVMPARNGERNAANAPFGWVLVQQQNLRVHSNWPEGGNREFDYGAIILPPDAPAIGAQVGWFGYGHFSDLDLSRFSPTLSGYPDDVPDGTQWFGANRISQITPTRIGYDIYTSPGQSGSPVFFGDGRGQTACAIHDWADVDLNSGVRITPEVISQIDSWKI